MWNTTMGLCHQYAAPAVNMSHVMVEKALYSVFTCVLSDNISRAEVCRIGMLSAFISDIHGYSVRLM